MPVNGTNGRSINAMPTSIRPKKKPAPPRPPQPKINRLQNSVSFSTAQDLTPIRTDAGRMRPMTTGGKDLIDFSTPPSSPSSGRRNTVSNISTARNDPNEFSYRVGASIFYIKSPLKNSVSEAPVQNPFSPPRPTADSIITNQNQQKPVHLPSNLNAAWNSPAKSSSTQRASVWDTPPKVAANSNSTVATSSVAKVAPAVPTFQTQNNSSQDNNNTIKSHYQNQASWTRAGASSSSNASSDRTSNSFSDGSNLQQQQQQQSRYSNVPDTLKKELSATLSSGSGTGSKPTIIRPVNKLPAQSSTEGSSTFSSRALMNSIKSQEKSDMETTTKTEQEETPQRNYYDVPPDEEEDDDFDDDDEANDSSLMASPPMPSEPPPPPPPDVLAVDEWVSSTTSVLDYPDTYSDAGQVTAYAIALYDFIPEAAGDLQLQAGDLVYLLRKVDEQWYHGSCGGMEGMFPSNFVNVMVPIPEDSYQSQDTSQLQEDVSSKDLLVDVLYDFFAETEGDLGLQTGEKVKILGRINEDWLYGEKSGIKGQFPAAFVEQIIQDLPIIKI